MIILNAVVRLHYYNVPRTVVAELFFFNPDASGIVDCYCDIEGPSIADRVYIEKNTSPPKNADELILCNRLIRRYERTHNVRINLIELGELL